jgi:hypothetical protein
MSNGTTQGIVITPVLTPHDNFAGRSNTRAGVGELIDLSFAAVPAASAADFGGLRWFVGSGGGIVTGTGGNDGRGLYTAPSSGGLETLELKVASGPSTGLVVGSCTITIVEPSDAVMTQRPGSGILHLSGSWSCAFLGEIFLRPTDISFANIQMGEGTASAAASGFLSSLNGMLHSAGPMCTVGPGDILQGCKVNTLDRVITGKLDPPFSDGDFLWSIPWLFAVSGSGPKQFTTADHRATSDASGQATISKKGAGPFSRSANDPTSDF